MSEFDYYQRPSYWDARTPLLIGVSELEHLYLDLSDNYVRRKIAALRGSSADLGCGSGRMLNYASVGVDFSFGMLMRAKRLNRELVRASILALPFKPKAFDSAFSVDVFIHLPPTLRETAYAEARTISRFDFLEISKPRTFFPYMLQMFDSRGLRPRRLFMLLALILSFVIDRSQTIRYGGGRSWCKNSQPVPPPGLQPKI